MSDQIKIKHSQFDFLGNILETLRFRGSIFFRSDLASPWGFSLSEMKVPRFHIVLKGDCYIGVGENQSISVKHMDIIMIPQGDMHWIADQVGRKLIPSELASDSCELNTASLQHGQFTNRLICGLVHYEEELIHPLIQSLPPVLHFSKIEVTDPIWATVELIDREMQDNHQSTHIVNRLTEVLFLQLLKKYVSENNIITGFFSAIRDPKIYQALELIHQYPESEWSLSSLGKKIGMSNATLNRHFHKTVGVSPMAYIANWRMIKTHNLLKYSNFTLEKIAESVGFSSARTLSKAFVRYYNYTPSSLRK